MEYPVLMRYKYLDIKCSQTQLFFKQPQVTHTRLKFRFEYT
jgi:hypothetical protein